MAEDIKSLTKKNADLEKRLKIAEAKIKALADNMTNPKDIEKFISVVQREQTDFDKRLKRETELQRKAGDLERKQTEKENDKLMKDIDKQNKDFVRAAELQIINSRLITVEALVKAALAR